MGNIFIMIVSTIVGSIGWWLGGFFGVPAALVGSTIGGVVGIYYGWKWNRDLFCE